MTDKVNGLMEKILKLENEANFEQWSELPPELKLECIKKMDFKMRFGLRSTSHTERALVDSLRYKFDRVFIGFSSLILKNEDDSEIEGYELSFFDDDDDDYEFSMKKTIPLLIYIFNKCDIEKLDIIFSSFVTRHWNEFGNRIQSLSEPIRAKNLYLNGIEYKQPMLVLEKCWTSIECVEIKVGYKDMPLDKVFSIPSIINTRKFVIPFVFDYQIVSLIKEWLKLDLKIGTKFGIGSPVAYSIILPELKHRKDSHDDSKFRISTDNPEKHILMFETKFDGLYCVVIPSNLDKSKYDELIRSF